MEPWEVRHAAWVAAGNACPQCEVERERGFHGPTAHERWAALLLACACWWDGTVLAVLRRWARRLGDGRGVWDFAPDGRTPRAGEDARLLTRQATLPDLLRAADSADLYLHGLLLTGPVQSRPNWEAAVAAADARSRQAWAAYADEVWAPLHFDDLVTV